MYFALYLFSVVSAIHALAVALVLPSGIIFGISLISLAADGIENNERAVKFAQVSRGVLIPALLVAVLLPNKEALAMIYIVPKLAESELIKKDVPEIYDLAVQVLKKNLQASLESK